MEETEFRNVVPVARTTTGARLRLTFAEPASGRMLVLEFDSYDALVESMLLEQMIEGVQMMRGLGLWPVPRS